MSLLTIPLVLGASYLAAYVLASLIVEGADRLGLVYDPRKEEQAEPEAVILRTSETRLLDDLHEAMHREAIAPHPHARMPIHDRIEALEREYARIA